MADVSVQLMAAAKAKADRQREQDARDVEQQRISQEQLKLSQSQNTRATSAEERAQKDFETQQKAAALDSSRRTRRFAMTQWDADPAVKGKAFNELPAYARQNQVDPYPDIADTAAEDWNATQRELTGNQFLGLPQVSEGESVQRDPKGGVTIQRSVREVKPTENTGKVFPSVAAAEAELGNVEGAEYLPDGSVRVTKVARDDISRRKLGVNEKNAFTGAVTAAQTLDNIESDYAKLDKAGKVGPLAGRFEGLKQKAGYGDQAYSEFAAQVGGNLFNLARSLQGAGVLTEQDVKRMESIVPTGNMNAAQFKGQLAGVRALMAEKLNAWKIVNEEAMNPQQRQEFDAILSRIQKGAGAQAITPALPSSPVSPGTPEMVRMQSPEGDSYNIPSANVEAARKRGFK